MKLSEFYVCLEMEIDEELQVPSRFPTSILEWMLTALLNVEGTKGWGNCK